jgi:hypothetical protein
MILRLAAGLALVAFATPVHAEWRAANPAVAEAAKDPRVAGALAAANRIDAAIVGGDKAGFIGAFGQDAVVNSPSNNVSNRAEAERRFQSGALTYRYLHRSIEYAGRRGSDEVVLMGEETYEPPAGAPQAGKTVHRRFTDLWRLENGQWRLSLRQATIIQSD